MPAGDGIIAHFLKQRIQIMSLIFKLSAQESNTLHGVREDW